MSDGALQQGTTAPTTNVALCMRAIERAIQRPAHLPGIVGFYGQSGLGKSFGAAYAASHYHAYYIECRDHWTRKAFLEKLLAEMGVRNYKNTIYAMADAAAEQLAMAQIERPRALIIDECDKPIDKGYIELIRDLYEGSGGAPILLIGEEGMEIKLRRFERVHNRVLDWIAAEPATLNDMNSLRQLYYPNLQISEDLLQYLHAATKGIARRICVNLDNIAETAAIEGFGLDTPITRAVWGDRPIYVGEARRRAS